MNYKQGLTVKGNTILDPTQKKYPDRLRQCMTTEHWQLVYPVLSSWYVSASYYSDTACIHLKVVQRRATCFMYSLRGRAYCQKEMYIFFPTKTHPLSALVLDVYIYSVSITTPSEQSHLQAVLWYEYVALLANHLSSLWWSGSSLTSRLLEVTKVNNNYSIQVGLLALAYPDHRYLGMFGGRGVGGWGFVFCQSVDGWCFKMSNYHALQLLTSIFTKRLMWLLKLGYCIL